MLYNSKMSTLLDNIKTLENIDDNRVLCKFDNILDPKIYELKNTIGEPYYSLKDLTSITTCTKFELTDLEWEDNVVRISLKDFEKEKNNVHILLKIAIMAIEKWTNILKTEFPNTNFDMVLSIDNDKKTNLPFAILRLYAIRDNYCYIDHDTLNEIKRPILIERV